MHISSYIIIYHHISALISVVSGIFLSKQSIGESPSVAVCHLGDEPYIHYPMGSMVLYMVTWIPSIYPSHVSINIT